MGNITDITTPWEGFTKGDVEDIIKSQFSKDRADISNKFAASVFDKDKMMQYFFASEDDMHAYKEGGGDSYILYSVPFNFSGTVNQVKIINEMQGANLYFTTQSTEAIITCSFISQQKGITDSSWTDVNEDFQVSVLIDRGGVGNYITLIDQQFVLNGNNLSFDVRSSLATGSNRVRVVATGMQTGSSTSLTYSVTLTTMYLAPSNFSWYIPFVEGNTYDLGGMNIGGNLQKVLRVRVSREEAYFREYEVNIGDSVYTSTAYTFKGLEFPTAGSGVYNVEIWLDANGLTSEKLSYNIICVKEDERTSAQLVSISRMPDTVLNFSENNLFEYCVYNKGLSVGSPTVCLDTIVNTNKTNIKTETLVDVPTNRAISYSTALELDVVEAKMQLSATIDFGNAQQVIYNIDNSKSYPATSEAMLYINPAQRSNVQVNRDKIVNAINSVEYDAEWTGFSWGTADGWVADKGGRMCLRVPAFSRVNIAHQPMADLRTPITMEFVYKVENASDYDDPIITICDDPANDKFTGIRITPKNICIHSRDLKDSSLQDYNTIDEQILDVIVTIVPNYKTNYGNLAQVYCNGVKVRSFEFTSIGEWNVTNNIILGSDTADLYLYKMRVYHKGFDKTDAMRNFINSLPDLTSRETMYNRLLSVTDDSYNLSYDACVRNGYNTMVIEMLGGKDIPSLLNQESGLLCNLQINIHNLIDGEIDDEMADLLSGVLIEGQGIEGQGTTAMTYGRWNFRWKLDKKYGKRRITAKKNVASSMQSHKMGATRIFNYLHRQCVGANEANANVAVSQYPVYGFHKVLQDDGITYMYRPIGLYTIGADKGDKHTFGYDQDEFANTLMHLEGSDHTPKSVGFDYPWDKTKYSSAKDVEAMGAIVQEGIVGAWEVGAAGEYETDSASDEANIQSMLDTEFKPAYNIAYNNSPYILCVEESLAEINSNIEAWRDSVAANGESYSAHEFFNKSNYNVIFYNELTKRYEESGVNLLSDLGIAENAVSSLSLEETTTYIVNARKERFVRDWDTYWHKDDAIFHYVFMLIFGATDNFKKNTYPYKFRSLTDGGKWRWRADDLDTIFDINNQGLAAKIYSILVGDKTITGSGSIYRGDNSAFWTLIKETQQSAIKTMVHKIFNAMVEHPLAEGATTIDKLVGFIKYFFWDFAQAYFPASAYNADTEWTYEDIWANKNAWKEVNPLSQALGGHYEAEQDWVAMRMLFLASYYNYGPFVASGYKDASTGQMVYGGAEAHTYEFIPSIDFNPTIIRGSTETITYGDRVKANTVARLTVSSSSGADTRVYVQGLDWIKDIGDLSTLTVSADNPTLNVASQRLQRLKIGDVDASTIPSAGTIKSLTLGDCPSMMSIDARNLSTLEGTIDLSSLDRLREAYFGGTNIKGVTLQDGSKIEVLELPASITSLKLVGLRNLKMTEKSLPLSWVNGVALLSGNNTASNSAYRYCDYVNVSRYTSIEVDGYFGSDNGLHFYDSNKAVISFISANTLGLAGDTQSYNNIIQVPENAVYCRLCGRIDADLDIRVTDVSLIIESLSNVSDLRIENCEGIDGFELMKDAYFSDNSQLSSIRLIGFEREADANDLTMLANMVNDINALKEPRTFTGIDAEGRVTDHPVIEGRLILNTPIYRDDEEVLKNAYGDALNIVANNGYYIRFADAEVQRVSATNWGDGTGTTEAQVKSVTILGAQFAENLEIKTFNEFEEFSNLTTFNGSASVIGGFCRCKNLKSIKLPKSLTTMYDGIVNQYQNTGSFKECESLTEISIPPLVTRIPRSCFHLCKSLETVTLEGKVVELAESSFASCISLLGINRTDFVETIREGVFTGDTNLQNISFPSLTSDLGLNAFYNCTSLRRVESLGVADKSILDGQNGGYGNMGVFYNCSSLEFVDLSSIISIGAHTFRGCTSLADIGSFNERLTTIGNSAFYNCSNLKVSNIPGSIESLGDSAFNGCASLGIEELSLPNLTALGSRCFVGTKIKKINNLGKITTIPATSNGIKSIFGFELEEVVLPPTIQSLGADCLNGCTNLYKINLPESITYIGDRVLYNCATLEIEDLRLPNLETLGGNAFFGVKIKKISDLGKITTLPSASTSTQNFGDKSVLEEINITDTVSAIPLKSFYGYTNLSKCIFEGSSITIGGDAFYNCGNLEMVEGMFSNVKTISYSAFYKSFQNGGILNAPKLEGALGARAFYNTKITKIENLGSLTELSDDGNSSPGCFYFCDELVSVNLPETIEKIGAYAFDSCTKLETINFPASIKTIKSCAFRYDTSLLIPELSLPNLEGTLGFSSFRSTRVQKIVDLGKITILQGNANTHSGVFGLCTELTLAILPETLTEVGIKSFSGCSSLETLIVKASTPPSLGGAAFADTNSTFIIYVPDGSVEAYKTATNWSTYADRIKPLSDYYMAEIPNHISDARTSLVCWYNTKVEGATNASLQADGLKDLSGNGYNLSMSGFEYTEESGLAADGGIVFSGAQEMNASGLPILTDFTVVAKRKWVAGDGAFVSKRYLSGSMYRGAFTIERNASGNRQESFHGGNTVTRHPDDIIWMTPTSYCGTEIVKGEGTDGGNLNFGNTYDYGNSYWTGSLYSFALFNRTLTDDEIEWVKNNMM